MNREGPAAAEPWERSPVADAPEPSTYADRARRAWDGVAGARRANCRRPQFFSSGGSLLEPEDVAAAGDVRGRRVLQLQCSGGDEALSWANLGADVVGVDISEVAIEIAASQAERARLPVEFRAADVLRLPSDLRRGEFAVVHSSAGCVCWIPDLDRWAAVIAEALAPGGTFVLNEHHPIWEIAVPEPDGVRVTADYFGRAERPLPPGALHPDKRASAAGVPLDLDAETFLWPLGDVITALAGAGLRIRQVVERSEHEGYLRGVPEPTPEQRRSAEWLPMSYLVAASRPER